MSYGNGYCFYGRDPVFADVDAYTDAQDAAEAHAEHVNSCINDAVDNMLAEPQAWMLLADLSSENGAAAQVALRSIYDRATGECSADTADDWVRVMLYAAPEHLPMLRTLWRDWVRGRVAEYPEVIARAEKMVAQGIADDYEVPL